MRDRQPDKPTLWELTGGAVGLAQSSIPSLVFVLVNGVAGLRIGIAAAAGAGIVLAAVRAGRKQSLRPIVGSFIGLAISSCIAWRTGSARDYFLPDIWFSLVCAGVLVLSMVIGWPLVGVVWSAVHNASMAWRADVSARLGYHLATAALAAMFAIRFGVQHWLYEQQTTGWMAVAKVALNYPLWALALSVAVWAARRSDKRLARRGNHLRTGLVE